MEHEQKTQEQRPAKLGALGAKLAKAKAAETGNKEQSPEVRPPGTSKPRVKGTLEVVSPGASHKPKGSHAPAGTSVESPRQATVKMDERMRMAWALMRAMSGRTLQELQHAAFHDYLKRQRAYELVDLHVQTADCLGPARGTL